VILATGSRPATGSPSATGSLPAAWPYPGGIERPDIEPEAARRGVARRTVTIDALAALSGTAALPGMGSLVVHDPVGGPVGVAVAEWLAAERQDAAGQDAPPRSGRRVTIVSPDPVIGTQLSLTGDLADANVRLQRAGVTRELRSRLRAAGGGTALLEDVWTGAQRRIDCDLLVDCGHRLPDEELYRQRPDTVRAGDCVAPRTVHEAILEGRRAACGIGAPNIGAPSAQSAARAAARLPVLK